MIEVRHHKELSAAQKDRTWRAFLEQGTNHSAMGTTLSHVIERCERERVTYRLTAMPGVGYFIEPYSP